MVFPLNLKVEESTFDLNKIAERRLLLALLGRAVSDILDDGGYQVTDREKRDAKRWMFVEDRIDIFSFEWTCSLLNISAKELRKLIRRALTDQALADGILLVMRRGQVEIG